MSELKDFYTGKMGHDYSGIENSCWYLSELALNGALEVDNYVLGRGEGFAHVQELTEILGKYQLKDTDTSLTEPNFPYMPLWRAVRKNSDKEIRWMSELALEMRLLRSELEEIPTSKKLEELRDVLNDFSREFLRERCEQDRSYRLVA